MAENRLGKSWSPSFLNQYDYENDTFVYADTLKDKMPDLYKEATNLMAHSLDTIQQDYNPSLDRLFILAEIEKKKEDEFLNKKLQNPRMGARTDGERIKDFNRIYQRIEIFNRNIKKIEAINEKTKGEKIDITSVFKGYLAQRLNKLQLQHINEKNLKAAVRDAIENALNSSDIKGDQNADHSYMQLLEELQAMSDYSKFVDDVFDIYLGSGWKEFQREVQKQGSATNKVKISGSKGLSGNLLEILSQRIMQTLGENAKLTGGSGQKADLVIAEMDIKIPDSLVYGFQSIRADFVKQWKDLYSNIKDSGEIVEISAKNYTLGNTFSGFTAQDKVTIDNFAATLEQFGFKDETVDPLVYALLNIGPDTLEQDKNKITQNLSTLIAYFLFDDINMDLGTNVNAIHLFNLNGIYVPLSSFLFAAHSSLKDFNAFSHKYVHVSYSPQKVIPETEGSLLEIDWLNTKIKKLDQQSIKIHFFKNFADYIRGLGLLK